MPKTTCFHVGDNSAKGRIRKFLKKKKVRIGDAEKKCGFSHGYLSAGNVMGSDKIETFVKVFPDADVTYIVTGKQARQNALDFFSGNAEEDKGEISQKWVGSEPHVYKIAYEAAEYQIKALRKMIEDLQNELTKRR